MAGRLRKLFADQYLKDLFEKNSDDNNCAIWLSRDAGKVISRQTVNYWRRCLSHTKKNGDHYLTSIKEDREIRKGIKIKKPRLDDTVLRVQGPNSDSQRILVIPDMHSPYHHPDTIEFLAAVHAKYDTAMIINLGDETDGHALSMHDSDPSLHSAGDELTRSREFLKDLSYHFPNMSLCNSNHGSLIYRRAFKAGIPAAAIKDYIDYLFPEDKPNWKWYSQIVVELPNETDVLFKHQSTAGIIQDAGHNRANVVMGHKHANFSIEYRSSLDTSYFGMYSGCLIDVQSLAFAYGINMSNRPIIGCSVIINSHPILIHMETDENSRWTGKLLG